jgi:hypothetical protein
MSHNYEVLGLMHVYVKNDDAERTVARQNVVQISVENQGYTDPGSPRSQQM